MAFSTEKLTTGTITGSGAIDVLMQAVKVQLESEFDANRITGNDYATVYTSLIGNALQTGTNYALSKERADAEVEALKEDVLLKKEQVKIAKKELLLKDKELELRSQDILIKKEQLKIAIKDALIRAEELLLKKEELAIRKEELILTKAKTKTEQANTDASKIGNGSLLDNQNKIYVEQRKGYKVDRYVKRTRVYTDLMGIMANANPSYATGLVSDVTGAGGYKSELTTKKAQEVIKPLKEYAKATLQL